MDNNLRKLQWTPYGTPEHEALVQKIQKTINSRDFILCTHGHYHPERSIELEKNTNTNRIKVGMPKPFEADTPVFKSDKFYFVRRDKAEYNLNHRQINVGLVVTDKKNRALVLQKENGYMSLVGGHTDFCREAYNMTVGEICYYNVTKELSEEVKIKEGEFTVPAKPSYFITEGNEIWDLFHSWFIYHVQVDNLKDFKFISGEPKKHDVKVVKMDDIVNGKYQKTKHSLLQAIKMILEDRDSGKVSVRVTEAVSQPNNQFLGEDIIKPTGDGSRLTYSEPTIDIPKPPKTFFESLKEISQ